MKMIKRIIKIIIFLSLLELILDTRCKCQAATLNDFSCVTFETNITQKTKDRINKYIEKIPADVVTSFNNNCGVIKFVTQVNPEPENAVAAGLYNKETNEIQIRNLAYEAGPTLVHELGHYIYFQNNGDPTRETAEKFADDYMYYKIFGLASNDFAAAADLMEQQCIN